MSIIDFQKHKHIRELATSEAEDMIEYIKQNCTQSEVMLEFLGQPSLKNEVKDILQDLKALREEMEKTKRDAIS